MTGNGQNTGLWDLLRFLRHVSDGTNYMGYVAVICMIRNKQMLIDSYRHKKFPSNQQ